MVQSLTFVHVLRVAGPVLEVDFTDDDVQILIATRLIDEQLLRVMDSMGKNFSHFGDLSHFKHILLQRSLGCMLVPVNMHSLEALIDPRNLSKPMLTQDEDE